VLDAEAAVERERCEADPEAGVWWGAYHAGWMRRRDAAVVELDAISAEEAGARDALARAFEEQKRFEHVAEIGRLAELAEDSRRETAELDEAGRLRAAR
jgi:flagellar FliJ protein